MRTHELFGVAHGGSFFQSCTDKDPSSEGSFFVGRCGRVDVVRCGRTQSAMRSKNSLPTPQMGQMKSSGNSSTYSMCPQIVHRQA